LNGQTLKSATSDYDQRHVIAFRPISVAARSWSYDKMQILYIRVLTFQPGYTVNAIQIKRNFIAGEKQIN